MLLLESQNNACEDLLSVLKRTIDYGENNSVLVIGPRGSGKTHVVNNTIERLKEYLKSKNCENDFIIVKLSGCLQLDDKSALLEISRQLELDNVMNDKVIGSFSDNFDFLLRSFRSGGKESKPLMFILDEFDLFTKHKSQLLLYTLLNTIQVTSNPMCLIGLTCRLDVLDLLEKRIKSRFSHRQIYLLNEFNFDNYFELAKNLISNEATSISGLSDVTAKMLKQFLDLAFEDSSIKQLLNRQFEYDKSIPTLKRLLLIPMVRLNKDIIKKKQTDVFKIEFIRSYNMLNADTKSQLLNGISILELALIIVMKQINEQYVDEPFNFDLVYNEYIKFCHKRNYGQKFEKQVVLKAYEHLISLKFIMPYTENGNNGNTQTRSTKTITKEHALMYLALDAEEINESIKNYQNCPTELKYNVH